MDASSEPSPAKPVLLPGVLPEENSIRERLFTIAVRLFPGVSKDVQLALANMTYNSYAYGNKYGKFQGYVEQIWRAAYGS